MKTWPRACRSESADPDQDRAPPRGDPHRVALAHAELDRVARVISTTGTGSRESSPSDAPGHGAGVPVVHLAPGVQDERILVARAARPAAGTRPGRSRARPSGVGKRVVEEERRALGVRREDRILERPPPLQHLRSDTPRQRRRHRGDLPHHVVGPAKSVSEAEPVAQVDQDVEVAARLARRLERGLGELDVPVGVDVGAGLLGEGRAGQHHVGPAGGLGEEEILHREELQPADPVLGVGDVRVGEHRVLAHDVQAADRAAVLHHLGHHHARARARATPPAPPTPRAYSARMAGSVTGR